MKSRLIRENKPACLLRFRKAKLPLKDTSSLGATLEDWTSDSRWSPGSGALLILFLRMSSNQPCKLNMPVLIGRVRQTSTEPLIFSTWYRTPGRISGVDDSLSHHPDLNHSQRFTQGLYKSAMRRPCRFFFFFMVTDPLLTDCWNIHVREFQWFCCVAGSVIWTPFARIKLQRRHRGPSLFNITLRLHWTILLSPTWGTQTVQEVGSGTSDIGTMSI